MQTIIYHLLCAEQTKIYLDFIPMLKLLRVIYPSLATSIFIEDGQIKGFMYHTARVVFTYNLLPFIYIFSIISEVRKEFPAI